MIAAGRLLAALLGLVAALSAAGAAPQAPGRISIERLLETYATGDFQVIERAVKTVDDFERLRQELRRNAVDRWALARRPVHGAFMIDLALTGMNRGALYWLDVIKEGRNYMMRRPDPPGARPDEDELEIAWHKTSIALLESVRRPDYVHEQGIGPLKARMAPEPLPTGESRLIDPWISLARGHLDEQWSIVHPGQLESRGPAAIIHFDDASKYASTRAEALTRKAWLLLRLGRPEEALVSLDAVGAPADDGAVLYWSRLFRGRALAALGRVDDAERTYRDARALVPDAQAPAIALIALEFGRNQPERAYAWAAGLRTAPITLFDPWWDYPHADFRFFKARLAALRAKGRQ